MQLKWNSACVMAAGIDFTPLLEWEEKQNPGRWHPAAVMWWTFMGVGSDQWKNGAAAVGTYTLTSVHISTSLPVSSTPSKHRAPPSSDDKFYL